VNVSRAVVFVVLARSLVAVAPQTLPANRSLPVVSGAAIPEYLTIAAQARIEGEVSFHVSTDGERVVSAELLKSPSPLLDVPAFDNLRTWRFEPHRAAQFDVTFTFSTIPARCKSDRPVPGEADSPVVRVTYPTRIEIRQAAIVLCEDMTPPSTGAIDVFKAIYGVDVILNPPPSSCCPAGPAKVSRAQPMFIRHSSIVGYPIAARSKDIEGVVRLSVAPDGRIEIIEGPPELAAPTLAAVRTWEISPPSSTAEIRFTYALLQGDCSGGGPIVDTAPHSEEVKISAKRIVACGPGRADAEIRQRSASFSNAATVALPVAFSFTRPTSMRYGSGFTGFVSTFRTVGILSPRY